MSRPRHIIKPIDVKISLPMDLSARLDILLWNPTLKKPQYGARSRLITALIEKWCDENEGKVSEVDTSVSSLLKNLSETLNG